MSTESESNVSKVNLEKCSLLLVDVAGTTTSIKFLTETLFPFVITNVESFLKSKWDEEPIQECIKLIKEDTDLDIDAAIEKIKKLTEEKSRNNGLKTLQGLIYKDGYEKGELKSHVFDDVPEALESWSSNRRIAIFSSGSIESQKLLFTNTIHGDLSTHIHKYFDQTFGMKTDAETYKKIAEDVEVTPEEIVFITDDLKEANAAKSAGCAVVMIKRDGKELPEEDVKEFTVISSFKELRLDKAAKRKIEEEPVTEEAPPSKVQKTEDTEEKQLEQVEPEEKPIEPQSMDVDTPPEKPTEETEPKETEKSTETETIPKETEKTEPESEKTEAETKPEETTEKPKSDEMETVEAETETKMEQTETMEEPKTEEEKVPEDVKQEETVEEKSEETKVVEETTPEEKKQDEETQNCDEKTIENGEEKPESSTKTEEKENKSVLANGVENGKAEVSNSAETSDVQIDDEKTEETEVCVKKLEESAESKTVSVEV